MRSAMDGWIRLWSGLTRRGVEREVEEEMGFHYEMLVREYESRGLSPEEARSRARKRFGEPERMRREAVSVESSRMRRERRSEYLSGLWRDVRFSARTLARNPTYAAMAVLVMAVGIGATTAIFSAANAFLFRPLPFPEPDRLVMLYETNPEFGWEYESAAPANVLDWRDQVAAFEDVTLYSEFVAEVTHVRDGEATLLGLSQVSGNFFSVLGVRPFLGRGFEWEETWEGRDDVVVLAHSAWLDDFGGDVDIIGRSVELNGTSVEVVGVMPPGFTFPKEGTDLWSPWGWDPANREAVWFRRAHWVRPIARLSPDVTVTEARAALAVVVSRLQTDFPETNRVMGAGLMPLRDFMVMDVRRPLFVLMGAVGLLLVLACTNVANLMLVRGSDRTREVALRLALGAGRARVARQLLTEGVMLSVVGGALGLGLGWAGIRALATRQPVGIEALTGLALDGRVLLFTLAAATLSGLLFAIAPALRSARGDVQESLKEGGRSATSGAAGMRTANGLVALEVALAVLLVVAAGLMVRSFWHLRSVDPGFRTENVLAVSFNIPSSRYPGRDQVLTFQDRFEEQLEARPGIERVGMVGQLPLNGTSWSSQFQAQGWPPERVGLEILHRRADAGYFEALDIPLLRGRLLRPTDGPEAPRVVVINETFARRHFPGEDPIGQRIAYDRVATPESTWREIVGIVGDQLQESPAVPARAEVFESRLQDWARGDWFVIRTTGDPAAATAAVRAVLEEIDPLVPLSQVRSLRQVRREATAEQEFLLTLLGIFGVIALLLAAVGVYGVTAQRARKRTHEIGIRMALGAGAPRVVGMMLRQGMTVVAIGLAVGIGAALVATRALGAMLHGVEPADPVTLVAVGALLAAVAALASYIPARRATRRDPAATLRIE